MTDIKAYFYMLMVLFITGTIVGLQISYWLFDDLVLKNLLWAGGIGSAWGVGCYILNKVAESQDTPLSRLDKLSEKAFFLTLAAVVLLNVSCFVVILFSIIGNNFSLREFLTSLLITANVYMVVDIYKSDQ